MFFLCRYCFFLEIPIKMGVEVGHKFPEIQEIPVDYEGENEALINDETMSIFDECDDPLNGVQSGQVEEQLEGEGEEEEDENQGDRNEDTEQSHEQEPHNHRTIVPVPFKVSVYCVL